MFSTNTSYSHHECFLSVVDVGCVDTDCTSLPLMHGAQAVKSHRYKAE